METGIFPDKAIICCNGRYFYPLVRDMARQFGEYAVDLQNGKKTHCVEFEGKEYTIIPNGSEELISAFARYIGTETQFKLIKPGSFFVYANKLLLRVPREFQYFEFHYLAIDIFTGSFTFRDTIMYMNQLAETKVRPVSFELSKVLKK